MCNQSSLILPCFSLIRTGFSILVVTFPISGLVIRCRSLSLFMLFFLIHIATLMSLYILSLVWTVHKNRWDHFNNFMSPGSYSWSVTLTLSWSVMWFSLAHNPWLKIIAFLFLIKVLMTTSAECRFIRSLYLQCDSCAQITSLSLILIVCLGNLYLLHCLVNLKTAT